MVGKPGSSVNLVDQALHDAARWLRQNRPEIERRAALYLRLMRVDRPIGVFLLMWPTLWALWIAAEGFPTVHLLLVFVLGVFLTRSAGCVINDYADRDLDRYVERTLGRPLATGAVSAREAFSLMIVLITAAFLLVLTTNRLTVLLSFAALPLGGMYPFMKRITYVPQFFMGLAFSWGIPMAFAATLNTVPPIAWLLFTANVLWAMMYDSIYAMVDRQYDKQAGIKSTAILFEGSDHGFIGIFQVLILLTLYLNGKQLELGAFYHLSLAAAAVLFAYQHYLIRGSEPGSCFSAFLNNNWVGAVVFFGIVLDYYR